MKLFVKDLGKFLVVISCLIGTWVTLTMYFRVDPISLSCTSKHFRIVQFTFSFYRSPLLTTFRFVLMLRRAPIWVLRASKAQRRSSPQGFGLNPFGIFGSFILVATLRVRVCPTLPRNLLLYCADRPLSPHLSVFPTQPDDIVWYWALNLQSYTPYT